MSRLLLPRFYQTGGARFVDIELLEYEKHEDGLLVSQEGFETEARSRLPEPVEMVL